MEIKVSEDIYLKLFSLDQAEKFYESIHEYRDSEDDYRERLQEKYPTLEKVNDKIIDALDNKFELDKTPDFFIYYKKQLIGIFEFAPLVPEADFVEVGYWLYRRFRRKGVLSSIFPFIIDYAEKSFNRGRLIATTGVSNYPSQKLLEKCGFRNTGKVEAFKKDGGVIEEDIEYEVDFKDKRSFK